MKKYIFVSILTYFILIIFASVFLCQTSLNRKGLLFSLVLCIIDEVDHTRTVKRLLANESDGRYV